MRQRYDLLGVGPGIFNLSLAALLADKKIRGLSQITDFIQDVWMRKSRLTWSKQRRLIELFVAGSTARTAASLVGVNKTTAGGLTTTIRCAN